MRPFPEWGTGALLCLNIQAFATTAINKDNYTSISQYAEFCQRYLDFVAKRGNLQATIVTQNENHYVFFQYKEDVDFQITRPINTLLMYTAESFAIVKPRLVTMLQNARELEGDDRKALNNAIYTIQQTVGLSLDALPAGASNTARKINGDLFERFIRLVIKN